MKVQKNTMLASSFITIPMQYSYVNKLSTHWLIWNVSPEVWPNLLYQCFISTCPPSQSIRFQVLRSTQTTQNTKGISCLDMGGEVPGIQNNSMLGPAFSFSNSPRKRTFTMGAMSAILYTTMELSYLETPTADKELAYLFIPTWKLSQILYSVQRYCVEN